MKRWVVLFFLGFVCACAFGQIPANPAPPISTTQLSLPLNLGNLSPVTQANLALVGNPGPQTACYWAVTQFVIGAASPVFLGCASNLPNILSSSNYETITPVYPPGISSVDILKSALPIAPSGTCNCAVATGVTSGNVNDQSNSTSSYAVSPVNIGALTYTIDNEVHGANSSHAILRQNGVFVADLSSGGAGCTPSSLNANAVVYLDGTSSCTSNVDLKFVDGGIAQLFVGSGGSGAGAGYITMQGPNFGVVNLNPPQTGSDIGWYQSSGRALVIGTSSSGNQLGLAQSNDVNPHTITSITRSSNIVTVNFSTAGLLSYLAFPANGYVTIAGVPSGGFGGRFKVLSSAAGTLTYAQTGSNASSSGGTVSLYAGNSISSTDGGAQLGFFGSAAVGNNSDGSYPPAIALYAMGTSVVGTRGGDISLFAGWSQEPLGSDTTTPPGDINLFAGSSTGGNNNAGNINLNPGSASGTGLSGAVKLNGAAVVAGNFTLSALSGGPFCLHETNGLVTPAGADCGSGTFNPTISSPQATQALTYNGSAWVNGYGGVNVDAQTGNYTFTCPTDRLGEIEFNLTAAATLSLPQAGAIGCTQSSMAMVVRNAATSTAPLTIAATTSAFLPENVTSISIVPGGAVFIYSDATTSTGNYHDITVSAIGNAPLDLSAGYVLGPTNDPCLTIKNNLAAAIAKNPLGVYATTRGFLGFFPNGYVPCLSNPFENLGTLSGLLLPGPINLVHSVPIVTPGNNSRFSIIGTGTSDPTSTSAVVANANITDCTAEAPGWNGTACVIAGITVPAFNASGHCVTFTYPHGAFGAATYCPSLWLGGMGNSGVTYNGTFGGMLKDLTVWSGTGGGNFTIYTTGEQEQSAIEGVTEKGCNNACIFYDRVQGNSTGPTHFTVTRVSPRMDVANTAAQGYPNAANQIGMGYGIFIEGNGDVIWASGGGCTTFPQAYPTTFGGGGSITGAKLTYGGAGCTAPPSCSVGSNKGGSGATCTWGAPVAGVVPSISISGGSGYALGDTQGGGPFEISDSTINGKNTANMQAALVLDGMYSPYVYSIHTGYDNDFGVIWGYGSGAMTGGEAHNLDLENASKGVLHIGVGTATPGNGGPAFYAIGKGGSLYSIQDDLCNDSRGPSVQTQIFIPCGISIENALLDQNGNPWIAQNSAANAVDGITVSNSATGSPATVAIGASGSDANINLNLTSKGSGAVQINGSPVVFASATPCAVGDLCVMNSDGLGDSGILSTSSFIYVGAAQTARTVTMFDTTTNKITNSNISQSVGGVLTINGATIDTSANITANSFVATGSSATHGIIYGTSTNTAPTAASGYIGCQLITSAGLLCVDSTPVDYFQVPAAATGEAVVTKGTTSAPAAGDLWLPEKIPAANCNNTTAGNGWSIGSGGTVACKGGTNNLGGYVAITDTSSTFAQFASVVPEDWDTAAYPYIRFAFAYPGTDGSSSHTIIPQIKVSCMKGDGSTSDDVTFSAALSSATTTLTSATANLFFSNNSVQMDSTRLSGCVAGSMMIVQIGRASDTATSAVNFYYAVITWPHKTPGTAQAN